MQEILGVRPVAPGFARVKIEPFVAHLAWARGTVPTPKGDLKIQWKRPTEGEARIELEVDLPAGVAAEVILPDGTRRTLGPGQHQFQSKP
jgi:alpha-L-rhamnosidase